MEKYYLELLGIAFGGGVSVKLLDILYNLYREKRSAKSTNTHAADDRLEPLLKAADEFVGKTWSLARKDFKTDIANRLADSPLSEHDVDSLVFLIGAYWAQIDLLRKSVSSVILFDDGRGTKLHAYLDCLESPEVRLFDRMQQRAIGEAFTTEGGNVIGYTAFFDAMRKDTIKHPWMVRLRQFVVKLDHKSERQRLLQYATVVHSMLDELDPLHKFSRNRPAMPNKLSSRTWNSLNYRVFGKYLTFVRGRQKYLGPPKKSGPKGVGKTN